VWALPLCNSLAPNPYHPHIRSMIAVAPIVLAVIYGLFMYHFSVWRTQKALTAQSEPLRDPELVQSLRPLARALDLDQIKVRLYKIPTVNGLATADGNIYLTQGFIDKFHMGQVTAAEIASVVAHELGHVALGHTRKRMIDFSGQNALRTALALILGRLIPGLGLWIANAIAGLLAARLSRTDEFEADAYATALMIKSGYGAGPQKDLFAKLDRLTGNSSQMPAWMLSHPHATDRIKAIEANEAKWTD
ncbi:MAG: M48 family metallopeptidase, partial [Pseudomonadota bacterium]